MGLKHGLAVTYYRSSRPVPKKRGFAVDVFLCLSSFSIVGINSAFKQTLSSPYSAVEFFLQSYHVHRLCENILSADTLHTLVLRYPRPP